MPVSIRASGEWGGALPGNVEAVVRSAAACFDATGADESIVVLVEPTQGENDPPIALAAPGPGGEFVVQLSVRGNLWARVAFQFAHEYCHVLAGIRTWTHDRFAWFEEVLCETASLYALRAMSKTWSSEAPYPNWQSYAAELERYASERIADPAHTLPAGVGFADWFAERLPLFEAVSSRRADNTVVAKELLPIFERDAGVWRAVRSLHAWRRSPGATLAVFVHEWRNACPPEHRQVVESIGEVLDAR